MQFTLRLIYNCAARVSSEQMNGLNCVCVQRSMPEIIDYREYNVSSYFYPAFIQGSLYYCIAFSLRWSSVPILSAESWILIACRGKITRPPGMLNCPNSKLRADFVALWVYCSFTCCGWSFWYSCKQKITESKLLQFAEILLTHLQKCGTESMAASASSRSRLLHFACQCPVVTIYLNLSPMAKGILVSTVVSGH